VKLDERTRWLAGLTSLLLVVGCSGGDDKGQSKTAELAKCSESGHACTWLGEPGQEGFNGDGHHRRDTKIYWSLDMLFASDGTPWFIDWNNHIIRRVLPDDTVETVVGWTDPVFPGDGSQDGAEKTSAGALGTEVQLNHPTDLLELVDGSVMVAAWHNHKLRSIDPSTLRVRILGGGGSGFAGDGGPVAKALFKQPKAIEADSEGNIYVLDQQNFRIRRVSPDSVIKTIAGSGMQGSDGDGGDAMSAMLDFEAGSNPEPSGGLAYREGKLYFSDTLANRIRVVDLTSGEIDAFAGTGSAGYDGDGGPSSEAALNHPRDLEFGPDDSLYVADTDNSVIRAIDMASGEIRTVAGTGKLGLDTSEGKLATETTLSRPFGIAFDAPGNLYISDTINSRILKVAR
jgi:hypothetical protein